MAGSLTKSEVMANIRELEVSPSAHDAVGTYGGKPSVVPGKNARGADPGAKTSEFQFTDRPGGPKIPGYKKRFASGAKETK